MSLIADISAFSNPFGTPAKGKWNLTPGIFTAANGYQCVFYTETRAGDAKGFHTAVDQITDSGQRRLAIYEYPYRDGQRVKDLGRKGETYTFNIKFFGPNYQTKYKEFYKNVYLSRDAGKLNHPVLMAIRGAVTVRLQSFDPIHRHDETNAVTFRAVFIEDNTDSINFAALVNPKPSIETALQKSLQNIVRAQANISTAITTAQGLLQLPGAVVAGMIARKNSLMGQASALMGQLASTFSSNSDFLDVLSSSGDAIGGVAGVSSGSIVTRTSTGATQISKIAPVFQVGLDASTQALVESQIDAFVGANQVTPQQAVFSANQTRGGISTAIAEAENLFGNIAYDIVIEYRALAVSIQETVEACITSSQSKVKTFVLPRPMSLRMIAFENGLSPDRQNDIEQLNPYLGSVNFIPAGSSVVVPAA